ncbi:MAG: hypothetical protein KME20_26905 [Kaiparowitsia implicata GSE-PSE-MK54-09C]|nr:hypothetical protein [Kaiparowitsia implicata GSE-PSE-MK54-09C]
MDQDEVDHEIIVMRIPKEDSMITQFPFLMANAAALGMGASVPREITRVILHLDTLTNNGSDESPRWKRDGDTQMLVATLVAPTEAEITDAVAKATASLCTRRPGDGVIYSCIRSETVRGDELCEYESEQVSFARQYPDYYRDGDLVYGACSRPDVSGRTWSPPAFAKALVEARAKAVMNPLAA